MQSTQAEKYEYFISIWNSTEEYFKFFTHHWSSFLSFAFLFFFLARSAKRKEGLIVQLHHHKSFGKNMHALLKRTSLVWSAERAPEKSIEMNYNETT